MKKITHWTNRLRHARIVSLFKGLSASLQAKAARFRLAVRFALSALACKDAEGVPYF